MHRQLILLSSLSSLCLLAACSSSSDPSPPTPPEEEEFLVKGRFRVAPNLAVYREVTETDWKPLPMITPKNFQFAPKGPYIVTVVCEEVAGPDRYAYIQQIARTPDDSGDLDVWCEYFGPFHVTGSFKIPNVGMTWEGLLSMGNFQKGPWTDFEFLLQPDTFDFLGHVNGLFITRRGIEVAGDTVMPPIDYYREDTQLIHPGFSVSGLDPMEQVSTTVVELTTQYGYLPLWWKAGFTGPIPAAPDRALLPSDVQTITVNVRSGQSHRSIRRKFREGGATALTLPARVDSVTFSETGGKLAATWTALPAHDRIHAQFSGSSTEPSTRPYYFMTMSRSFEEAMGTSSIALDAAIPGYEPRWLIDPVQRYFQYWAAERDDGNDTSIAGKTIEVNVPTMSPGLPAVPPHAARRLALPLRAP